MKQDTKKLSLHVSIILLLSLLFFMFTLSANPLAAGSELPDLPPSPTPINPTPLPDYVIGGFIELKIKPQSRATSQALWAQVQWLAGDGMWYDIEGWKGHPREDGAILWYVAPSLLGANAHFRWQIYEDEAHLATSDTFVLPQYRRQTVITTVFLTTEE